MSDVEEEIRPLLIPLNPAGKLAFVYSVAVRMQPQYQAFCDHQGWGNPALFQTSLDVIWSKLMGIEVTTNIDTLLQQLEDVVPDLDDHDSYLASYGFDAGCAIYSAMEYLLKNQDEQVLAVATFARDTADMYVQVLNDLSPDDPALEKKIVTDPYMVNEVHRQVTTLQRLQGVVVVDEKLLNELAAGELIDIDLLHD